MTASETPLTSDFGRSERYNQGADRGEVGAPPRPLDTPTTSSREVPGMTRAQSSSATPRILVTGSRNWTDEKAIDNALKAAYIEHGVGILVSGACPTGADAIAERIWESHGFPVERHPADWERHGKAAGPKRNQEMVDLGAVVCLAFPLPDSRGTKHCMGAAERAGIPVVTPCDEGCDPAFVTQDSIDSYYCAVCEGRGVME